ncbi:3-oxoadipate enol-lactonase [Pigmentiphaga soli]|uniref:3-oxoadipate enol-lactonase n=1 Tax=Pigmentiphaga soli TaxID=1007095 RepID=A0ABP8H2B1_9BURK
MSQMTRHIFRLPHSDCEAAIHVQGPESGPPVFMAHAILTSSMMWDSQAALLAARGYRVLRADTRGHGASQAPAAPYAMDDLVDDIVDLLDALAIERAHYVGLSLGGMAGFGLGIRHPERVLSLCLCDARADAPADFAAPWDDRIALAQRQGCAALADPTIERWFGKAFVDAHPDIAARFRQAAGATAIDGLVGCARAIQGLDYRAGVGGIAAPVTMIVGANDAALPQAMKDLQGEIPGAALEVIDGAGHLPNIDQPARFDAALLGHLARAEEAF